MRRRIAVAVVAVATVVVVLLGLPLAIAGSRYLQTQAEQRLETEAARVAALVEPLVDDLDPALTNKDLASVVPAELHVVIYDGSAGVASAGLRPQTPTISARVPVAKRGWVLVATRNASDVAHRQIELIVAIIALGLVAIGTALVLARLLATRLTAPLAGLIAVSERIGGGDFTARLPRSGLPEVDALAGAVEQAAARIEQLVRAEREFSANASHQLRTPLTALRMRLEEIDDLTQDAPAGELSLETKAALAQADRLEETITDLLALARTGRAGAATVVDVGALVGAHADAWRRLLAVDGRRLQVVTSPGRHRARASRPGLEQALETLVDNAHRHGSGTVRVEVSTRRGLVEVRIGDEGAGVPPGMERAIFERHVSGRGGSGVGLDLASTLVAADGGRLELERPRPALFVLRLPAVEEPED